MQPLKSLPAIIALVVSVTAGQAGAQSPQNPAIAMTNEAMVATGTCVAKYVNRLDNANLEAAAVAKQVAARCQQTIARSVGLATLMSGRPDDYAKNLEYINAVFTTNAVIRARAASSKHQIWLEGHRGQGRPRRPRGLGWPGLQVESADAPQTPF